MRTDQEYMQAVGYLAKKTLAYLPQMHTDPEEVYSAALLAVAELDAMVPKYNVTNWNKWICRFNLRIKCRLVSDIQSWNWIYIKWWSKFIKYLKFKCSYCFPYNNDKCNDNIWK